MVLTVPRQSLRTNKIAKIWRRSWKPSYQQTGIDYQMIGEYFHYDEEMGVAFSLGLTMRILEACVRELLLWNT